MCMSSAQTRGSYVCPVLYTDCCLDSHSKEIIPNRGKDDVVECSYVENNLTGAPFFATPCLLGEEGVQEVRHYGKLSDFEQKVRRY